MGTQGAHVAGGVAPEFAIGDVDDILFWDGEPFVGCHRPHVIDADGARARTAGCLGQSQPRPGGLTRREWPW